MFPANQTPSTSLRSRRASTPSILVIDDGPILCDYLQTLLAGEGYAVTTATSGAVALAMLDDLSIHLAILEIALDESDGLQLLQAITSRHPRLPVLVLTSIGYDEDSMRDAQRAGAAGYLSKRLPPHELLREVHHLLAPQPARSTALTQKAAVLSLAIGLLLASNGNVSAITLDELRNESRLTPQRFAKHFSHFTFKRHEHVQDPETFLKIESGDCDDYATLAASVLREKGYSPRLITVRMRSETHVVVYIPETRCYLDFNNRLYLIKTVSSTGALEDIARKVARSFDKEWLSVSEFTYTDGLKQLGTTILASKAKDVMTFPVGFNS